MRALRQAQGRNLEPFAVKTALGNTQADLLGCLTL